MPENPDCTVLTTTNESFTKILTEKLNALTQAASKESIRTLTRWIIFHERHYSTSILKTLQRGLTSYEQAWSSQSASSASSTTNSLVCWNIIHEILISFSNVDVGGSSEAKWTSYGSFRVNIGETVIQSGLTYMLGKRSEQNLPKGIFEDILTTREKLIPMIQTWEELNCFDSITLIDKINRLVSKIDEEREPISDMNKSDESDEPKDLHIQASSPPTPNSPHDSNDEPNVPKVESGTQNVVNSVESPKTPSEGKSLQNEMELDNFDHENSSKHIEREDSGETVVGEINEEEISSPIDDKKSNSPLEGIDSRKDGHDNELKKKIEKSPTKEYDFESEGIPQGEVSIEELRMPSSSIATMQITRDLRNDSSHNLSALLSKVPQEVFDACEKAQQDKLNVNLEDIPTIHDDVLDMDFDSVLSNLKLHREIIEKQKEYRQQCIQLLIKSRCQFGSTKAAELFYKLDEVMEKLQERKASILDAMDLEGLDFEAGDNDIDEDPEDRKLEEFSWATKKDFLSIESHE